MATRELDTKAEVMIEPILVIHGVANHDEAVFKAGVALLQKSLSEYSLKEVFWGDLGGNEKGLVDSLPIIFPGMASTRGADGIDLFSDALQRVDSQLGIERVRSENEIIGQIITGALGSVQAAVTRVRTEADNEMEKSITKSVPTTTHIKQIKDAAVLQAIGNVIAASVAAKKNDGPLGNALGENTRGGLELVKGVVERVVDAIDNLIGKIVGSTAGAANQFIRNAMAPGIARTLGDIVAYHHQRNAILARVFVSLDKESPGFGTKDNPITVIAHSLGGLVAFDALLGLFQQDGQSRPLHIKKLVTFGSQVAFFHIISPREGLDLYTTGHPVTLPLAVNSWTNLWHPMDLLAFITAPVFKFSNGSSPSDIRVDAPMTTVFESFGWMHSVYWKSDALLKAIKSD